jgi:threonine/homoserine/homoserine lactone efflux protein
MSLEVYLAYFAASFVIVIVPGPTVALIVANSLTHGARAGLLNVAGTQAGLALIIGVLALGLASVIEVLGAWFDWLRLAGAAYLIWLGCRLPRSSGRADRPQPAPAPRGGFLLQGFLVAVSNPKMLLFFGAFIPQFADPAGDYVWQVLLLGGTSIATAAVCDSAYAVLADGAGAMLSRRRARLLSRLGGVCLVGGGLWLALARAR